MPCISHMQTLQRQALPAKPQSLENPLRRRIAEKHLSPKPVGLQAMKPEINQRSGNLLAESPTPPVTMKAISKHIVPAGEVALLHAATADEVTGTLLDNAESIYLPWDR